MTDFLTWWADHWPLVPIILAVVALDFWVYHILMVRAIWKAFESVFGQPTHIDGVPVDKLKKWPILGYRLKRRREP